MVLGDGGWHILRPPVIGDSRNTRSVVKDPWKHRKLTLLSVYMGRVGN